MESRGWGFLDNSFKHRQTFGFIIFDSAFLLQTPFYSRALGQGAFGEVYQGYFKKSSTDSSEVAVAVKTLPELSTNQGYNLIRYI